MGRRIVKRGNTGKAVIRFLIGVLILAIAVLLLYEFVLNGEYDVPENPVPGSNVIDVNATVSVGTSALPVVNVVTPTDNAALPPVQTVSTPAQVTATPTPEATPTPTPSPTPIVSTSFSTLVKNFKQAQWKIAKIDVGLTKFEIPAWNAGQVIEMEGWGFVDDEAYDGKNATVYLIVMNSSGNKVWAYTVEKSPNVSGIDHIGSGTNLGESDFHAILNVSGAADDTYEIGLAIQYINAKKATARYMYTFGDTYKFTVSGGAITAVAGISQ